jgi:hypothetical protein
LGNYPGWEIPAASGLVGGFSFRHIGLVKCFSAFKSITSNVVEADGISVKFLKLLLPLICCYVLHVFNLAITSSVFSSMWKVAIIRTVAKVGTPSGLSDFHPISIVSVLSNAFERILHDQVLEHVNGRNLLSDFQSGFRHGCYASALVRFSVDLRSAKAERNVTVHVLLDFSKAFDLIDRQLMGMVSLFLRERSMVVEINGVKSVPRYLSSMEFHRAVSHLRCFFYVYQ